MENKLETPIEEPIAEGKCCHFWVIVGPKDGISKGVCKRCGAKKEFKSSFIDSQWWSDISRVFSEPPDLIGFEPDSKQDDH